MIDTASAAERLALKGTGFATSNEVAAAIREGVATKLVDAVMRVALSASAMRTSAHSWNYTPLHQVQR